MTAPTQLRFNDHILDTTPTAFGPLRVSTDALADRDELHRRMVTDGYLYLPGFAALTLGALAGSPLGIRFSRAVRDRSQAWLFLGYLSLVLVIMVYHTI